MSARPIGKRGLFRLIRPAGKDRVGPFPGLHGVVVGLLAWICRPRRRLNLDSFSDHMLRDIGLDPEARKDSSTGFWRRR
jgi:uncharacterized protein YjiS (DUF1127 family)